MEVIKLRKIVELCTLKFDYPHIQNKQPVITLSNNILSKDYFY